MVSSAYIHIPFCKSKCKYCSFVSFNKPNLIQEYIAYLKKEIEFYYRKEPLETLYFGGGTPSLLSIEQVFEILSCFNLDKICEITMELNPDDVSLEYLRELKNIGINRISIGSQTFNDDILMLIGRRHNACDIKKAVLCGKEAGFANISVDLMYGLPTQKLSDLETDLKSFLELDIQHISTYGLKIEENSFFGKNPPKDLPDDDIQADMYEKINNILANNGFIRYEISNFAKEGYHSRHNMNYWNNAEYYGFGVASHGYLDENRYSNVCTIEKYIENCTEREFSHKVTLQEKLEEEIFLGLRKTKGLNIKEINQKYEINFENKYAKILSKYSAFLEKTPQGYAFNLHGVLLSNQILAEFLSDV